MLYKHEHTNTAYKQLDVFVENSYIQWALEEAKEHVPVPTVGMENRYEQRFYYVE